MEHQEFTGTWKEIWQQKGAVIGTKEGALEMGGWNKTVTSAQDIVVKMSDFLNIKSSDRILEIGCGAGGMAQYLNCDYIGIDYSKSSVERCMEFFHKPALCAEANNLPFRDKFFDKCFAYGCFMYFENWEYVVDAISEMKRVTKDVIFIGELPMQSHEPKHQLFKKEDFQRMGFEIYDGWAEPYQNVRFHAVKRLR